MQLDKIERLIQLTQIVATLIVVVVAVVVLSYVWTPTGRRRAIHCPNKDAESSAAMHALWPLASHGIYPTDAEIDHMVSWAKEKQNWLNTQNFDPCVRKAYQGWIDHVGIYQVREARKDQQKRKAALTEMERPEFKRVVR